LFKRVSIKIEWVIFVLVVGLHLFAVFAPPNSLMNWFTSDDGFYYFKTAQNIAEGRGVSFDGLGATNGFHPLWMAVLVPIFALARLDLILPLRIVLLVMTVLNAGSAVLLYRIVRRAVSPAVGVAAAVFWAFFPDIHKVTNMLGMESGLYAFFLLLLLAQVQSLELRRAAGEPDTPQMLLKLGITAALLLLSRLDNIFLVAVMGLWVMFRSPVLRYLLLGDLVLTLVSVFASYLLRLGIGLYFFYSDYAVWMAVVSLVMRFSVYLFFGLYGTRILIPNRRSLWRIAVAASAASALVGLVMIVLTTAGAVTRFPRAVLVVDWALGLGLAFALRYGVGWVLRRRGVDLEESAPETDPRLHWKPWLQAGLRYYGPLALTLAVYLAVNVLYAGTPMPVSGQIKRWWGTIYTVYGYPEKDLPGLMGMNPDPDRGPWWEVRAVPKRLGNAAAEALGFEGDGTRAIRARKLAAWGVGLGLAALAAGLLWANRRWAGRAAGQMLLLPLLGGSLIKLSNYKFTTYVETLSWYWVAEMAFKTLLAALLLGCVYELLQRVRVPRTVNWGVSVVIAAVVTGVFTAQMAEITPWKVKKGQEELYLAGVKGVMEMTEPGAVVGSTGGGVTAYFIQDRTVVNLDGLISSYDYFQRLKAGTATEYLDEIGMDYVYAGEYILVYSQPYTDMFAGRLDYVGDAYGSALYRYLPAK